MGVWTTAAVGVVLKLVLPGRFDRMAVVLYVVLTWSGAMFGGPHSASFQTSTLWFLAAGGGLYSKGLIVHLWPNLRFRTAIWHASVLLAASCHYAAVLNHAILVPA